MGFFFINFLIASLSKYQPSLSLLSFQIQTKSAKCHHMLRHIYINAVIFLQVLHALDFCMLLSAQNCSPKLHLWCVEMCLFREDEHKNKSLHEYKWKFSIFFPFKLQKETNIWWDRQLAILLIYLYLLKWLTKLTKYKKISNKKCTQYKARQRPKHNILLLQFSRWVSPIFQSSAWN